MDDSRGTFEKAAGTLRKARSKTGRVPDSRRTGNAPCPHVREDNLKTTLLLSMSVFPIDCGGIEEIHR